MRDANRLQRSAGALLMLVSVWVSGCAPAPMHQVDDLVYRSIGQHVVWPGGPKDVRTAAMGLLNAELTLDQALQISLANNAGLQAKYEELGIAQADLMQAGLLQNPVFSAEMRFPGRPHFPIGINVEQQFIDILFLGQKKKIAQVTFSQTAADVADAVLHHAAEVRTAYYRMQGSAELVALRTSIVAAAQANVEATQKLREAGNIRALDLDMDKALLAEAQRGLLEAKGDLDEAREKMNSLMGLWGSDAVVWGIAARLGELPEKEIPLEGLESLAIAQRQDLLASQRAELAAGRVAELARSAAFISGGSLGASYQRDADVKSTLGPSISLPIPIFDQGQVASARAASQVRQAEYRSQALAVEIRSQVRKAYNRMENARQRVEHQKKIVMPLRHRIVEEMQLQYNGMFVGVAALLQSRQEEIQAGVTYIDALRDYWMARADLQAAIGSRLPDDSPAPTASRPMDAAPAHAH